MIDLTKSRTDWPISIKIKRGLWTYILEPMVIWLPKVLSPLRISALRMMGASIGRGCLILPGVRVLMPWNLTLAEYVAIGERTNIYNFATVSIGRMTVISQNSYLCTGSHDYRLEHMPLIYSPIAIGEECWIAAGAFIAPGVSIPNGVVVGAMSVVTRSLTKESAVYAGNPCRLIKDRAMREPVSLG